MHNFLKNQFELEDRQVKQFRTVFSKWDVEGRGEINVSDLSGAVASCGAKLHPQILKVRFIVPSRGSPLSYGIMQNVIIVVHKVDLHAASVFTAACPM